ncbi:MAG: TetR/AcrR family transcriptional regulator [Motiliproteus sp.]|nr:TetR/AcrR family transcriptional regulator [Motiliproteus sp.]MCW9051051.1 TetR/AcrR family transcriptional regulator [Motiliproteus sp.]
MPSVPLNKDQLIERIVTVFRQHGYEGASLAILSKETGLGRSSLYHHFPNGKVDMAKASLEWVMESFAAMVLQPLKEAGQTPLQQLENCASGMAEFYGDGNRSCLINIFSVGMAGTLFQKYLAERVIGLIEIFAEFARQAGVPEADAKARAERLVIEIQGALVLSRTLGTNQPFLNLMQAFPQRLLQVD